MAVKIRMRRMGRKNRAFFRIVAADARSPRDGRFIEILGTYDPFKEEGKVTLERERVLYWIGVGAQVSDAVAPLLRNEGIDSSGKTSGAPRKSSKKNKTQDESRKPGPRVRKTDEHEATDA